MRKAKKHFHSYIVKLFLICIFICLGLENLTDFVWGFIQGFTGGQNSSSLPDIIYLINLVFLIIMIFVFGCIFYRMTKKQVADPIEELADCMHRASLGDLEVRVPTNGKFEFQEMQTTFNDMVEKIDKAYKDREQLEKNTQKIYSGIAHDLKTPMTMILGYAKVLDEKEDITQEDKRAYIDMIIKQTKHANGLLDNMLAYARLESKEYYVKKEKKDLAECLRSCVADFYRELEEAQINLDVQIPEDTVSFLFDEVEMRRVFLNLLTNMVKHNPKGTSGMVSLEERQIENGKRKICIVIADNGPKIEESFKDHIFDCFVVGDASRNAKNGSGLGLAIIKKIVERHDGCVEYVENWCEGYKGFVLTFQCHCPHL